MRHYLDDIAVHRLCMDCTIAFHVMLGIAGASSEGDSRGAVVKYGLQNVATKCKVDVPRAFQHPQDEITCLDGVGAVAGRVVGTHAHAHKRVVGKQLADGVVVNGAEAVEINGEVDAVVKTANPVEVVFVPDNQGVVAHLGGHFINKVFRAGQFQVRMTVLHQLDIHVVEHRNHAKRLIDITIFGDRLAVGELVARCDHQANEEKQDCDNVSLHVAVDSICVVYDSPLRC